MSFAAIINYYRQNTLRSIIGVAFLFRFIAVVFSTGYGFHDDHFLTVEVAQSWVDGVNFNEWLPDATHHIYNPQGPSLSYPSTLCAIFWSCEKIGIDDPASKMIVGRLLHAMFSLLIIFFGYKIIEKLYDKRSAELSAWMLALMWFIPMLSVRNLVEMVCIPFLFWGIWLLVSNDKKLLSKFLLSGIIIGLAFSIRFQTSTFIAGLGIAVLFRHKILHTVIFGLGILISVLLIQGLGDWLVWGFPFTEFKEYIRLNIANVGYYPDGPWYNFTLLVAGLLLPPLSILIIFGFLKEWKKHLIIVLPVLTFFIFHSSFPNKQERFILPAVPFIIMLGTAGWYAFYQHSKFWQKNKMLHKILIWIFIILNSVLLVAMSFSSSKLNRVEAMRFLSSDRTIKSFVVESTASDCSIQMPLFYLRKQWPLQLYLEKGKTIEQFCIENSHSPKPNYVLFIGEENLHARVLYFQKCFHHLTYQTTTQPSLLDKVMSFLNPVNINEPTFIYKVE